MIYIASDHGGFDLKERIIDFLKQNGYEVEDKGAFVFDSTDDYSDFTISALKELEEDPNGKAILLCRNGVGVSILANKFKGVRAALSWNKVHARTSRNDDNSNVLALPADFISEKDAFDIVETWLNTPFSNTERHIRRLGKIGNLEETARYE